MDDSALSNMLSVHDMDHYIPDGTLGCPMSTVTPSTFTLPADAFTTGAIHPARRFPRYMHKNISVSATWGRFSLPRSLACMAIQAICLLWVAVYLLLVSVCDMGRTECNCPGPACCTMRCDGLLPAFLGGFFTVPP